jgi:hypothetical protein
MTKNNAKTASTPPVAHNENITHRTKVRVV